MSVRIEHNFDIKSKEIKKYAKRLTKETFIKAMHRSLDEVGFIATGDYMDLNASFSSSVQNIISRRSGRLSRSILGSEWGGKNESIRKAIRKGEDVEGLIGSKTPYAAIQEFGGTTHPKITKKSRGFFWHQYFTTGDDKWKGMALSKKDFFKVNIPARPYLRPAKKDAMPEIHNIFNEFIHNAWDRANI